MGHKSPYMIKVNNSIIPAYISKPEQGSKSREFSELIHKDLTQEPNILNIYICPCRRNQANQAEDNFMNYNEYYKEDKNTIDVLHGEKQSSKDPDGYIHRAKEKGKRTIISICHKIRLEVIRNIIIEWINLDINHKVKIYLDEAGEPKTFNAFINHIWKNLEDFIGKKLINVFPIFIDAHSKSILNNKLFLKYYPSGGGTLHKLKNKYNLDNYIFMSSMTFNSYEWDNTTDILNDIQNKKIEINYNDYILWPSPKVKYQQYEDAEEISSTVNDSCVLVINGDGYHIYKNSCGVSKPKIILPKKKCSNKRSCGHITCPKCNKECNTELDALKIIKKIYATNIPLILCGHDCIDRAMTYHSNGFSFTKGFIARNNLLRDSFSNNSNKSFNELSSVKQEKVSQMVKRMCGSFKAGLLHNNRFPIIYGPQDIYDGICDLENISTYISNQEGYLTKDIRNEMDNDDKMLCKTPLLNESELEHLEKMREPYEYYFKSFNNIKDIIELNKKLTTFRQYIGGSYIQRRAIEKRLNGIEPDQSLGELKLNRFKEDYQLLKTALDENTTSRFRVCRNDVNNIIWIIHFQMKKNEFIWNNLTYKIITIPRDGNCLFNSFIKSNLIKESISLFRLHIYKELSNNQTKYDESNSYTELEWDERCQLVKKNSEWDDNIFDYCIKAISEKYNINIYIYNLKTLQNGGYEILNEIPVITPDNESKTNNIYLRRLDNSHFDLMEIIS